MSDSTEYPQVVRSGYVDEYNGMFEIVQESDCADWNYFMEHLTISITEPAVGGEVGVVKLKLGEGDDWFEFNAHSTGVYMFSFGDYGYPICRKGSRGFQMICCNAEDKQAKAWVLFKGHRRIT